jgi:hypothetical protein
MRAVGISKATPSTAIGEQGGKALIRGAHQYSLNHFWSRSEGSEIERGWGQEKNHLHLTNMEKSGLRVMGTALQQALHLSTFWDTPLSHLSPHPFILGPSTFEGTTNSYYLTTKQ